MKNYQSSSLTPRQQNTRTLQQLQPIMEYEYPVVSGKNRGQNVKYASSYKTQMPQAGSSNKKQTKYMRNQKDVNKNQKEVNRNGDIQNESTRDKQSAVFQNGKYSSKAGGSSLNTGYNSRIGNKQVPIQAQKQLKKLSQQKKQKNKVLSQYNQTTTKHNNPTTKQTPIPPQPAPTYNPSLFPPSQSSKQKLKQNVQQEMLSNYYIDKYSTIMSKMTNQNIKIELPVELTERSSFSTQREKQSIQKKRVNFKQAMKQKASSQQVIQQVNQSQVRMDRKEGYKGRQKYVEEKEERFLATQFLATQFEPLGRYQVGRQKSTSRQVSISKSVNKTYQNKDKQEISPSKVSNKSNSLSQSPVKKDNSPFKQHSPSKNQHLLNYLNNNPYRPRSNTTNHQQVNFNSQEQSSVSPPRHNFKQSLKQKKSLFLQYQQNYDLYKKLQSSIINELYSPSPKKIQSSEFQTIQFINRQMTTQEKLTKYGKRKNNHNLGNSQFSNIEINDNQEEFNFEDFQRQLKMRQQRQEEQNEYDNKNYQDKQISLLRQSIRNSINLSHSRSSNSSPDIHHESPKNLSSRRSPHQSPTRSFISNKNKNSNIQSKNLSERNQWNPNFTNSNSRSNSKKNDSPMQRVYIEKESPEKQQSRKYKSLEKNSTNYNKIIEKINQASSKTKDKNKNQHHFRNLQLQINEEQQLQSQIDNNHKTAQHNESYNEVAHKLGTSINLSESSHKQVSFKPHIRKGSFHSVKSSKARKHPSPRLIKQTLQHSINSNQTVNEPSQEQDADIEFIPAAQQNHFQQRSSKGSSQIASPRRNLIQTVGHTRSRKQSDQLSFFSDRDSYHEMSMLSRFSMTSDEGAMIVQKLENQITENQFGPYQYALQSLRELLYEHKTAWPIYVVGQRVLDDRNQYEKKIQLQGKMLEDYRDKILQMKMMEEMEGDNDESIIMKNKLQILRLLRDLASTQ